MLIDIPGPVTEDIICSRPPAVDRSARASAIDGWPPGSGEVPLREIMVIAGDHARPACIDIRVIAVDKDIPVAGKSGTIESCRPVPVPCVSRMISRRTPPAAAPATPATMPAHAPAAVEPAKAIAETERPTHIRIVTEPKTPGPGPRIVEPVEPGIVIEPRSVNDRRSIDISIQITRRIAHIDIIGGHIIDINILQIVIRRCRRDLIDLCGPVCRYCPRPVRTGRLEPNAIVYAVINPILLEYRRSGVGSILHIRPL